METRTIKTFALLLMGAMMLTACDSGSTLQDCDKAKDVLLKSRERCIVINGGHYVMQMRTKYISDNDTSTIRHTCDFKKKFFDPAFKKVFLQHIEYNGNNHHTLYTGKELLQYDDTAGTIMDRKLWADEIKDMSYSYDFYTPLTSWDCYPLPSRKDLKDTSYTYFLSDTMLDGKPCYLAGYRKTDFNPDTIFGINTLLYEVNIWIDKQDYLPVQYSVLYVHEENRDTTTQYEECRLLEFTPEVDESKLTMASVPPSVKLKDFEPYQEPEPLAEGSLAPDWSLPTLTGDTVRLADLRGKVVLVDFFYKSCAPCCAAMPFLQQLHEKYKDQGVVMIGIDPYDDPVKDEMADFLSKRDVTYPVLFYDRELSDTYRVSGYPTLFFIDREGKIAKVVVGYGRLFGEDIETQLKKML